MEFVSPLLKDFADKVDFIYISRCKLYFAMKTLVL